MHTKNKDRFRIMFLIGCYVASTLFFANTVKAEQCCPFGTSELVRQRVQRLYELSGTEPYSGIVVASLPDHAVDTLLAAFQDESNLVKNYAVQILIDVMRQIDISQRLVNDRVIPALSKFLEDSLAADSAQVGANRELGRLALWCAEQHILDEKQRVSSLLNAVRGSDNARMQLAIDILVNMKGEEAKDSLLKAAEQKKKQGLKEAAHRIMLGVDRINIQMELKDFDIPEKISYLSDWLHKFIIRKKGWGVREFVIWLIIEIELTNNDAGVTELKKVWQNKTFNMEYRYTAQEALIRLNRIKPSERNVRFL